MASWNGWYSRTGWHLSLPTLLSQVQHVLVGQVLVLVNWQVVLHAPEVVTLSPKLRAQILLDKLEQIFPVYPNLSQTAESEQNLRGATPLSL